MKQSLTIIPIINLLPLIIPVAIVFIIHYRWSLSIKSLSYACVRMITQLFAIGFVLNFIFKTQSSIFISFILMIMFIVASWIALRPVKANRGKHYFIILFSLMIGCLPVLGIVIFAVLQVDPWYSPSYIIPLGGMIFSNGMNALSLAADRFRREVENGTETVKARNESFLTSLIPLLNMFFAVGLVSLPGMMTGQILSGIGPLIAARYQIMVMAMVMGASSLSSATYLHLVSTNLFFPESKTVF